MEPKDASHAIRYFLKVISFPTEKLFRCAALLPCV